MIVHCPECRRAYDVKSERPQAFRCKCGAVVPTVHAAAPPVRAAPPPIRSAVPPPVRTGANSASPIPPVIQPVIDTGHSTSTTRPKRPKRANYWSHPGAFLMPTLSALVLGVGGAFALLSDYPLIYFGVTLLVLFFVVSGCLVAALLANYRWMTPKPHAKMLALINAGIFILAGVCVRGGIDLDNAEVASGNKAKRLASSAVATRDTAKPATGLQDSWKVTVDPPPVAAAVGDYPLQTQISWYAAPPAEPPPLGPYDMPVSAAVSSGQQRFFALCTADTPAQLQVWDLQSGALAWSRSAPGVKCFVVDVSPNGQRVLLGQDPQAYPSNILVVSASDPTTLQRVPPVMDGEGSAMHGWLGRYRFLSDQRVIYFRFYNAKNPSEADSYHPHVEYHVLDLSTLQIRKLEVEGSFYTLPTISPGGKWLATAFSKQLNIYHLASGTRAAHLEFKSDFPHALAFSPDGGEFAYQYGPHSGPGCGLRIIDVATGRELAHFRYAAASHEVFSEAGGADPRFFYYSRDGSRLIYNGLTFIDRQTGQRLAGRTQEPPIYLTWARAVLDQRHVLAVDREQRSFGALKIEGL